MGRFLPNSSSSTTATSRQFLDIPLANGYYYSNNSSSSATHAVRSSLLLPPPALHLSTSREESTRVQLQKQRLREQHHAVVVSQRIPGFKTSAAFFASLRTNLHLNASPPPSPLSTPPSMRASTGSLPPPSPLSAVMDASSEQNESAPPPAHDPMAGIPDLKTYAAESEEDKTAALRLVADSVAQMRQNANTTLTWHPLNLAVLVAVITVLARYILQVQKRDLGMAAMSCTGLSMSLLVLCRWFTGPYLAAAERINFEWLGDADVFVTKFGEEIIGTVIVDWVTEGKQKRKKPQRGEIKGWTVRLKYRGKGVGAALLETVVQESRKKGAETVEFADDHANSTRVLPSLYNRRMDKEDAKARERLQDLVQMSPSRSKKR